MENIILNVLVGSRGHEMHRDDSDFDYRCVFVTPTEQLFSLENAGRKTLWQEGEKKLDDDLTGWEIGHFLNMASRCNPTILEVFGAPKHGPNNSPLGDRLQSLLPAVIDPKRVWESFTGYSQNQWRKLEADKYENRGAYPTWEKYAVAAARVLRQGRILLDTGELPMPLPESERMAVIQLKDAIRAGEYTKGQLLDHLYGQRMAFWQAYQDNESKWSPDREKLNAFLLEVRRKFWSR